MSDLEFGASVFGSDAKCLSGIDLEEAFKVVDKFGPYQKRAVAVLVLTQVYMACQSMLVVLVGHTPEYWIEQQGTAFSQHEVLHHVTFTEDTNSIVTEWLLIKQQAYKVSQRKSWKCWP
ncbi:Solute carrier family 22 member 15-like [Channa argus]|uniref:Solute carrier family 22 member 15-like n=1 Tax=Channa argus TaxID=215402 RepID=A0A6G1QZI9_CHAAH|nr:Solute carrier family 22 member 15-like [Channa argus]